MKNILSCLYHAMVRTINHDGIEHAGYMSFMILLKFIIYLLDTPCMQESAPPAFLQQFTLDFTECIPHSINDESFLILETLFRLIRHSLTPAILDSCFLCLVNQFTIKVQVQKTCKQNLIDTLIETGDSSLIQHFLQFCLEQEKVLLGIEKKRAPEQGKEKSARLQQQQEKLELILDLVSKNKHSLVQELFVEREEHLSRLTL